MKVVVGLEIHIELKTQSKIFCSCRNEFGASANSNVCPVCLGLPGSIPVLNKKAVDLAITAGLILNSSISETMSFDRKNYFYPDLPKGYQITQHENPICTGGSVRLSSGKEILLERIHLEEDAGKLIHDGSGLTLIDYNRSGVPLIEIVTKPMLNSGEEVVEFLKIVKDKLSFANVSDCKMELGELRVDVNISIMADDGQLGTRVEIKNLNSLKAISKAINFEKARHEKLIADNQKIISETRGWDEGQEITFSMREKQSAYDYRYFPEPDLTPIAIDPKVVSRLAKHLPDDIDTKKKVYSSLGLDDNAIDILTSTREISEYFDECFEKTLAPKETANWLMTELLRVSNEMPQMSLTELISTDDMSSLIAMVIDNKITRTSAKLVIKEIVETQKELDTILKEFDFNKEVTIDDIIEIIDGLIESTPNIIEDYLADKDRVINYIIGGVMKTTRGIAKIDDIKLVLDKMINKNF